MPTKQLMKHCPNCNAMTMHLKQSASHVLHLLLSLFTFGLWLLVWLVVALWSHKAQCAVCGHKHP